MENLTQLRGQITCGLFRETREREDFWMQLYAGRVGQAKFFSPTNTKEFSSLSKGYLLVSAYGLEMEDAQKAPVVR